MDASIQENIALILFLGCRLKLIRQPINQDQTEQYNKTCTQENGRTR